MELRTYTTLWKLERKLYRINDLALPVAISYKQLGILAAFAVPWSGIILLLHLPLPGSWTFALWLMPIIFVAMFANKPIIENKTGLELLVSGSRFLVQSKTYARMRPFSQADLVVVRGEVWRDVER